MRFAWRGLLKSPGFAFIAMATLALGIGANTAIFTVVNAVLVRPLPFPDAGRLVRLTSDLSALKVADAGMSQPELIDYRNATDVFEDIAGLWAINANLTEIDEPERVEVLLASPSYFQVLGVAPQLGRLFGREDEGPGITEVVVISDGMWRRRFGASPDAIGRRLRIDNDWYRVIGVLPAGFRHPGRSVLTDVEVWAPASFVGNPFPSTPNRNANFLTGAIARLKPGVTVDEARLRLASLGERLRATYPAAYPARSGWAPRLVPLQDDLVGSVKPALMILFGAVGFVLLIACANIANLLLARGSGRERELAVRRALGATRTRLVRLLLTESALLALLGGLAATAVTAWLVPALLAIAPPGFPRLHEIAVDGRVLAFNAGVALATAILFGTVPALQFSKADVNTALKEGGRGASGSRRVLRSALVVTEFTLALVLLIGAALLVRSFWRLQRVDLGFNPRGVVTARMWLPQPNDPATGKYFTHPARAALFEDVLRRARALPGVTAAAAATTLPLDGSRSAFAVTIEGHENDAVARIPAVQASVASAGYFDVMGIRMVRGRSFASEDSATSQPVAIVTSAMARQCWPGEDPIGRRVHVGGPQSRSPWMIVVGVVSDVRSERLEEPPRPMLYRPLGQVSNLALTIVLKSSADAVSLGPALAREVRAADRDLPTYGVRSMEAIVATATASRRFATQLLGAFAVLSLLLAAVGIYGVMAFLVGQRTREIGVRIALGARPARVVLLVLGQALALAAAGIVAGVIAASVLTRLLGNLLFEIRPTDASTYVTIAAALAVTAALAAWRPARRAARVDPIIALRAD